ncbi:hypothetical protein A2914_01475 [Candidatus Nomurabacteria bacterium RIFCSPLOWO2_01_FULL_41_21]|uniref:DoxX family protein n=1 Tax=Candidatus Nomurabacteria bacterium RIFCSPLOWO2_01_FULL_41_21 TaxID=1801776 RepID=A0A1F6X365_9BACT|nr:MAG: hypothetical protein A2914_01475 [Candidatus Nomurabacteria bacterium RIFCSPLOWO2_01_FULL_41_21]
MNNKKIEWILRIAVAGEFLGHGVFALQGKPQWIGWMSQMTGADTALATQLIFLVGLMDILVCLFVLFKPVKIVLLWAFFWGFWTALLRPLVGEPILDFIERWANWGAPLALLLILGWPQTIGGWFKSRS